jgi:hypothetical protein
MGSLDLSGWMKQRPFLGTWTEVFCVLEDSCFSVFKDSTKTDLLHSHLLSSNVRLEFSPEYCDTCLTLQFADMEIMLTSDDIEKWRDAIVFGCGLVGVCLQFSLGKIGILSVTERHEHKHDRPV